MSCGRSSGGSARLSCEAFHSFCGPARRSLRPFPTVSAVHPTSPSNGAVPTDEIAPDSDHSRSSGGRQHATLLGPSAFALGMALPAPFASFADRCTSVSDKEYFPYEPQCGRREPRRRHARACPEGVLAVVCLDNQRDNTGGKALWTSLPSLGPQEECPWRLSDVIPARMVSHTLRTWTCSHLTWRGQSSRPPAISPSRVRPTAVSAIGTMRRAASTPFSSPEARWRSRSAIGARGGSALETPSCSRTSRDKGTPAGASVVTA